MVQYLIEYVIFLHKRCSKAIRNNVLMEVPVFSSLTFRFTINIKKLLDIIFIQQIMYFINILLDRELIVFL